MFLLYVISLGVGGWLLTRLVAQSNVYLETRRRGENICINTTEFVGIIQFDGELIVTLEHTRTNPIALAVSVQMNLSSSSSGAYRPVLFPF